MTYTPTREDLELAALACGKTVYGFDEHKGITTDRPYDPRHVTYWQPHLPTTQGKADLLDLMLAADIDYMDDKDTKTLLAFIHDDDGEYLARQVSYLDSGNKHAALAEAALKVAAMVGAKMRGVTPC